MTRSRDTMSNPSNSASASPLTFPLGVRCAKCQRFILRGSRPRRSYSGRWRHESCQHVPEPGVAEFTELAEVLMQRQPWPKLVTLQARLSQVLEELDEVTDAGSARVPRQATPETATDATDPHARSREQELLEQSEVIRDAIEAERTWRVRRLEAEWADGH